MLHILAVGGEAFAAIGAFVALGFLIAVCGAFASWMNSGSH